MFKLSNVLNINDRKRHFKIVANPVLDLHIRSCFSNDLDRFNLQA